MAENRGLLDQLSETARNNPAVGKLRDEARDYAQARGQDLARNLGGKIQDATDRLQDAADSGGVLGQGAKQGARSMAEGGNPIGGALKGAAGGLKDKVKGAFGGGGGGDKATKATIIIEEIDIGAPVDVVYDQWTQFQDYSGFMKKVEHAELDEADDKVKVDFKAQVFWSHRRWEATVKEQVPDEMITWRSQGDKGHVDGTVTFHELAPRLTRVLVVLEYYPQGFMERTGNIWRAQGRRARLELKHFRRHVMMNAMHDPDELEGWRGEVRDGSLVRSHDDAVDDQGDEGDQDDQDAEGDDDLEDEYEEPEDEYDDEDLEDDEPEDDEDEDDEPEDEYDDELDEEDEEDERRQSRRRSA